MPSKPGFVALSNGVTLEYVTQGRLSGAPVLLVHGLSDSWRSFERVLPALPDTIRAFVPSLRGHGDSSRPADGYTSRDFAADLAAFVDALQVERVVIAGHSMGSMVARRFAIDHAERTRALVLVGSFARQDHPGMLELQQIVSTFTDPVDPAFVREFQESTLAQPVPQAYFETIVQESLKVPAYVWRAAVAGLLEDDTSRELHRIAAPTLIVGGERDELCPPSEQEALAQAIEGARLSIYPATGHAVHWEEPERFASDLVAFVEVSPG